jgi:hypothetical protein
MTLFGVWRIIQTINEEIEKNMRIASFIFLIAAFIFLPAIAAETDTMSAVENRLSEAIKLTVKWQAPYGAKFIDEFDDSKTLTVDELVASVMKLNRRMAQEHPKLAPFVVCVFDDAVLVRTVLQPICGNPSIERK